MPATHYALEAGGPKRLTVSWEGFGKNFRVTLDGEPILTAPDHKALNAGRTATLPDGSQLTVQFVHKLFGIRELQLSRNGSPLPETPADPETRVKVAARVLFFLAVINALAGIIAEVGKVESLREFGFGAPSIIFGAFYGLLGFFVQRRSTIALVIAIAVFGVDGVASVILVAMQSGQAPIAAILVRVVFLYVLIRGIGAIRQLKAVQRQRSTTEKG